MEDLSFLGKRPSETIRSTPSKPEEKRGCHEESGQRGSRVKKPLLFGGGCSGKSRSPKFKVTRRYSSPGKLSSLRSSPVKVHKWTFEEERALTEFLGLAKTSPDYGLTGNEWPSLRQESKLWKEAALHIRESTSSNILLTSSRIRARVVNFLRKKFSTVAEAEMHYNLSLSDYLSELEPEQTKTKIGVDKCSQTTSAVDESISSYPVSLPVPKTTVDKSTQMSAHEEELPPAEILDLDVTERKLLLLLSELCKFFNVTSMVNPLTKLCDLMQRKELVEFADFIFLNLALSQGETCNPKNYVYLSLEAMKTLADVGKSSLVCKFVYALGSKHPTSEEPLMPINRMPFGLIQYQIEFFSATNVMQLTVPPDFMSWYETMCATFPTRFSRLFNGPMWSGLPTAQQKDPLLARVNIAAPSIRTVGRRAVASEYSAEPGIQFSALKHLKEAHPKGRFWIKVDACDLKAALQESTRGVWNGDVNLNDGKVASLHEEYIDRQALMSTNVPREQLQRNILKIIDLLNDDVTFLANGLESAADEYQKKFDNPSSPQQILMALCWERVEFNTLLQQAQSFLSTFLNLARHLVEPQQQTSQVATCLKNIRDDKYKYLRNLYAKKRQPAATHVLVFLVSEERRNRKPYALPVQYIPYKSVRDQHVRDLVNEIKEAMVAAEMKPVGNVTDGEFSSLRTQGETRPLHLSQIIHDAKESVSRQSKQTLLKMLIKLGEDANGAPVVESRDEAIPFVLINDLDTLRRNHHMSLEDAITYLRGKLVPNGYDPYPFRRNAPESFLDKLRSLIATYRFLS